MKIIILTAVMSGGGTERVISVFANYLVEHRHEVTILMTAGTEVVYKLSPKIKVESIGNRTGGSIKKRLDRINKIRHFFKQDKDAVVISFGMETNLFAVIAGLGQKNKIILSERNDPNQCGFKLLRNILYHLADGFVFQTEGAKKYFDKIIQKRGIVIANPIKEELPVPYQGIRKKRIATVGRLQPQKNHNLLLEAFAEFHIHYPEYQLVIYGKGELEESLRRKVNELKIENQVLFEGFAENAMEQIREDSIFVLSSDYEGISNSLMEAMAMGMPVISTDCPIGGSALLIQNEVNGLLVPIKDRSALSDAMKRMAKDFVFRDQLAKKACSVREKYSSEQVCAQWLAFTQKIGEKKA